MSYADWTFYRSANVEAFIVLTGELGQPDAPVGAGWLHWYLTAVGGSGNAVPQDPPYEHVLERGALRGIFRRASSGVDGGNRIGLLCLQNQEDMREGNGGTGYGAFLYTIDRTVRLEKFDDGLQFASTVLAESADNLWADNAIITLELAWDATAATIALLGGVVLSVRMGSATDYSDLQDIALLTNCVDASAPYTDTVAFGLGFTNDTGFFAAYCDQTQAVGP